LRQQRSLIVAAIFFYGLFGFLTQSRGAKGAPGYAWD